MFTKESGSCFPPLRLHVGFAAAEGLSRVRVFLGTFFSQTAMLSVQFVLLFSEAAIDLFGFCCAEYSAFGPGSPHSGSSWFRGNFRARFFRCPPFGGFGVAIATSSAFGNLFVYVLWISGLITCVDVACIPSPCATASGFVLRFLVISPLYEDEVQVYLSRSAPTKLMVFACADGWLGSCLVQLVEFRGFVSVVMQGALGMVTTTFPVSASAVTTSVSRLLHVAAFVRAFHHLVELCLASCCVPWWVRRCTRMEVLVCLSRSALLLFACADGWLGSCLVQLVDLRGFISAAVPLSHLVATSTPIIPVAASAVAVSMVRDLANVAAASGLMLESSAPAFILESRAMLAFSVALSNLTVMARPCFGLIPATGLPLHVTDAPVVVVTPYVTIVSQHASAVSDVADVIVSVDYACDDVEWLDSIGYP